MNAAIELSRLFLAGAAAATLALSGGTAHAARGNVDGCLGGTLSAITDGTTDLVVKSTCTVNAGTYKLDDVNILQGGKLVFTDAVIDFWANNIVVENEGSLVAGSPAAPIGTNGGVVTIHLYGAEAGGEDAKCLADPTCGIQANSPGKVALPGGVNDYAYAYQPLHHDAGFFGRKVLAVAYGGTLQLFGRKGATYATGECGEDGPTSSRTSWARLDADAAAGSSTLVVDRKLALKKGDRILVTTTDYLPGHTETLTVKADVACGTTITVDESLKYVHSGRRFPLKDVPATIGLDPKLQEAGAETRAAVALLSRSIRIVSAGDTKDDAFPAEPPADSKTPGYYFGGHVIARQGFKRFQMQGVELYQLGQGGRIGHYPVHFHMARRTPCNKASVVSPAAPLESCTAPDAGETFVKDSSIWDSMTRWIVLHGTQNVLLARNVGYRSIGHGFYLEDGTEIDNTLQANLGVFARAAIDNVQNPRKVPGILAAPDLTPAINKDTQKEVPIAENPPYQSDYDHPTVFWIMNGWNDFRDNMAAGAGTCGVCYWYVPGFNSTASRSQRWESYASMQSSKDRAGTTPLKSFSGNACTAAMSSFLSVLKTAPCFGIGTETTADGFPIVTAIANTMAPNSTASNAADYYPNVVDFGHMPTVCNGETADCGSSPPVCSAGTRGACAPTILDHYTTSFNWAAFNFAAVWLRPQWFLVTDSVITDAQGAGLSIVTGGGYDAASVIPGQWGLVRKSVFIGHTQENNPLASNGGPFNPHASPAYPSGLRCAMKTEGSVQNRPGAYCLSRDEGVSFPVENFGMYQRLFSLYDGPVLQDSNAYLNIKPLDLDDCKPWVDTSNPPKSGRCDPLDMSKPPRQSAWLAGFVQGLRKKDGKCYMPNAAIGWKQPNGFYYPPANHSVNLHFGPEVEIRHFVVSPLFEEGTLAPDFTQIKDDYCVWNTGLFTGFAGNDRQTVLNDDDGTLNGYKKTIAINLDPFFSAPVEAIECRSDASSRTSPYDYVTSVVFPQCAIDKTCALPAKDPNALPFDDANFNSGNWNRACTNQSCFGVPLYRQNILPTADAGLVKSIRMMGQETGQRSSLTVNRGTYYLDTSISAAKQLPVGRETCTAADVAQKNCAINAFTAGGTYYLFLLFAKESTEQTYQFYVGDNSSFDPDKDVELVQAQIGTTPPSFKRLSPQKPKRAAWLGGNKATAKGVVEVTFGLADLYGDTAKMAAAIKAGKKDKCQPASYCTWDDPGNGGLGACNDVNPRVGAAKDAVCRWAIADWDCPEGGCVGIRFTLPADFKPDPAANPRPAAACADRSGPLDVPLVKASDGTCPVDPDPTRTADFCK